MKRIIRVTLAIVFALVMTFGLKVSTASAQVPDLKVGNGDDNSALLQHTEPMPMEDFSQRVDYPAYQCIKTPDPAVYCSSSKVKNHDAGNKWVKMAIAHWDLTAAGIKVYSVAKLPSNAALL